MSEDTPVNIGVSWPEECEAGLLVRKMQVKLHHWAEADSCRRFNGVTFSGASSVKIVRYRHRGTKIPTPWTINPATTPA
jgi:hypothetical protein